MNLETQERLPKYTFNKISLNRIALIALISFTILMLAVSSLIGYTLLVYDRVYKGIYINDVYVGGLTKVELSDLLKKKYEENIHKLELQLKANNMTEKISFSKINISYDIQTTVNRAYGIGRHGTVITRLNEVINSVRNGVKVDITFNYNKDKVEGLVNSLHLATFTTVKEADLLIEEDKIILRSGHHGESIDKSKTIKDIEESIKFGKGGVLDVKFIRTPQKKISVDEYYNMVNREVRDSTVEFENGKLNVLPEIVGRSIDKASLAAIAAELENADNLERVLPVIFIKPKVTTEDIYAKLFKDTLATMSTQFYTSNQNDSNRGENIRIASSKINGKILAPGEKFSFNDVVGERTEEGGYKVAHAYFQGKIIDEVGGGICQVSTTLYNAVLFADLDVNERINHMFTVGYVPKGRDAAVSYGAVDLKFTNSTSWPIKIVSWVTSDNRIFFSIKGTSDTPGKTVEIYSEIVETLDFETKYIDDPNRPEGETEVKTEGMTGYKVDTYKIIKQDGKIISNTKLHRSIYNPLNKEVIRGTKKQ